MTSMRSPSSRAASIFVAVSMFRGMSTAVHTGIRWSAGQSRRSKMTDKPPEQAPIESKKGHDMLEQGGHYVCRKCGLLISRTAYDNGWLETACRDWKADD
jgi:hypothetical protein